MIHECLIHSVRSKHELKGVILKMSCPMKVCKLGQHRLLFQVLQEIPFHPQSHPPSFLATVPDPLHCLLLPPTLVLLFYYILSLSRGRVAMIEWMGWVKSEVHSSPHSSFIPSLIQQRIIARWLLKALETQWRKNHSWEKKEPDIGSYRGFISYFSPQCLAYQRPNIINMSNPWEK